MNFIKNTLVYLLLLVFDVKTIVNETEKLESCVANVGATLIQTNESSKNLLRLIDRSTVILKAFCSENLINIVDDDDDDDDDDDNNVKGNVHKNTLTDKISFDGMASDEYYDDYYFYKSNEDRKLKILLTFTPITIYKGFKILRQLELFNNQEYFQIKGQLNATLELEKHQKMRYQKKCFNNPTINSQSQHLNENHLIEKQIRYLVPGQLIIFGKLDKNNRWLVAKTNGIFRWQPHVENFLWNNLGWSEFSEWSTCSKSCHGIQQRYRHCLTNQQNDSNAIPMKSTAEVKQVMDGYNSATIAQQPNQHLCNGYNIEQRECNLFECREAVNLLALNQTSTAEISAHINQVVDQNDFTIMFTIRSKVNKPQLFLKRSKTNQHLMLLKSQDKQSSLTMSLTETGIKIVQEIESTSEMFAIKLNLFDLRWHQIAFSFRRDGLITCYIDCIWDSSFVMAKGSFKVPQPHTAIEMNSKLNDLIEWNQLTLVSGNHERSQCSNERTPIYDNNKLLERMFNDEAN